MNMIILHVSHKQNCSLTAAMFSFQEPVTSERCSYMLHPLYSNALLESTNVVDHIIAFKGTSCSSKGITGTMYFQGVSDILVLVLYLDYLN